MKKTLLAGLLLTTLGVPLWARPKAVQAPVVKVAILLDTSSSMDGLIDQARRQLWKIVNELNRAELGGKAPRLQVALYEYGNSGLSVQDGYIRRVLPLTGDLDRVSEALFQLKTNGGEEYCGQVIERAVKDLEWSASANDMQAIFIAGNEPFNQGKVPYQEACAAARRKGIIVNTIHCGSSAEGVQGYWDKGAELAGGKYLVINQDQRVADVPTPYDKDLQSLSQQLNGTYIQYGREGAAGYARQSKMDEAAGAAAPSVAAERAVSKSSSNYNNASWDLVDARKGGSVDVGKLKKEELPKEMQGMTPAQRQAYVDGKLKQRQSLQTKIQQLTAKRQDYIAKNQPKASSQDSLDSAMLKTIRVQASAKGYKFKK